jgi:hypothetical protein
MTFTEPSEQTIQAIDNCRGTFAKTRGVTRNAIDHVFASNTHDPYALFRDWFKDVCATPEANPRAYMDDMQSIYQRCRPAQTKRLIDAIMLSIGKAHNHVETCAEALSDGGLDKKECRDIEKCINGLMNELTDLKASVINHYNILNGSVLPNEVRDAARKLRKV